MYACVQLQCHYKLKTVWPSLILIKLRAHPLLTVSTPSPPQILNRCVACYHGLHGRHILCKEKL